MSLSYVYFSVTYSRMLRITEKSQNNSGFKQVIYFSGCKGLLKVVPVGLVTPNINKSPGWTAPAVG